MIIPRLKFYCNIAQLLQRQSHSGTVTKPKLTTFTTPPTKDVDHLRPQRKLPQINPIVT